MKSLKNWLPTTVDRRVRVAAWATLVSQILIIGTGGAVRLTGSGLGCPTWPRCTDESFVNTAEMGLHGIIEFGNRLLTFLLIIIAIAMFAAVVRMRRERPELLRLSVVIGLGIPAQAVLGGITVLTNLNPYVVGLHYVLSAVLVGLASVLLYRVRVGPRHSSWAAPVSVRVASGALLGALAVSILLGVLTTGSGPHAGDGGAARNGLNSEVLQHIHAWSSYGALALTFALTAIARATAVVGARFRRSITALLIVTLGQIAIGIYQARNGLPELFVGVHLVLAAVIVAIVVSVLLSQRAENTTEATTGRPQPRQTATSNR